MEVSGQLYALCRFTSRERAPGPNWIGGCVGPGTGVDTMEKRKIAALAQNRTRAVQPVTHCYID
jgi:hypothetical protein